MPLLLSLYCLYSEDKLHFCLYQQMKLPFLIMLSSFLVFNTAFYIPLCLVNTVRFCIQGMGYSRLAILAGVCEMVGRIIASLVLVPIFGFVGICLASPIAWIMADLFLVPAYCHTINRMKKY